MEALEYGLVAYVLWQKEGRSFLVSCVCWLFGVVGKGGYARTQTQAILRCIIFIPIAVYKRVEMNSLMVQCFIWICNIRMLLYLSKAFLPW